MEKITKVETEWMQEEMEHQLEREDKGERKGAAGRVGRQVIPLGGVQGGVHLADLGGGVALGAGTLVLYGPL